MKVLHAILGLVTFVVISCSPSKTESKAEVASKTGGNATVASGLNLLADSIDGTDPSEDTDTTPLTTSDIATAEAAMAPEQQSQLDQMATSIFSQAGKNPSDELSLDEFINAMIAIRTRVRGADLPANRKQEITDRMTKRFTRFKGDDGLLHYDGLKLMLIFRVHNAFDHEHVNRKFMERWGANTDVSTALDQSWADPDCGPGVPCMEFGDDHGGSRRHREMSWEDIMGKYDKNHDAKLDEAEFGAMINDVFAGLQKRSTEIGRALTITPPLWADVLSKYDGNKDGVLERDELDHWRHDWSESTRHYWANPGNSQIPGATDSETSLH